MFKSVLLSVEDRDLLHSHSMSHSLSRKTVQVCGNVISGTNAIQIVFASPCSL